MKYYSLSITILLISQHLLANPNDSASPNFNGSTHGDLRRNSNLDSQKLGNSQGILDTGPGRVLAYVDQLEDSHMRLQKRLCRFLIDCVFDVNCKKGEDPDGDVGLFYGFWVPDVETKRGACLPESGQTECPDCKVVERIKYEKYHPCPLVTSYNYLDSYQKVDKEYTCRSNVMMLEGYLMARRERRDCVSFRVDRKQDDAGKDVYKLLNFIKGPC